MIRSRHELIIQSAVSPSVFCVGELRLIKLPKRKFNYTSRIVGDPFPAFCADTILYAFENLLVNKVLTCHTDIENKSLPLTKHTVKDDYFTLSRDITVELGFIEGQILRRISAGGSVVAKDLIRRVIDSALIDSTYTNPWKEFIRELIEKNCLQRWEFEKKDSWFASKIEISFRPTVEHQFQPKLDSIVENIFRERKLNTDFLHVSDRLRKHIEEKFDEKSD